MPTKTHKFPPKTLLSIQPAEIYAASYVDGNQEADTRLVVKIGPNFHFLHQEGVDSKLRQPASWLQKAIAEKLSSFGEDVANLPEESVELPREVF